MFWFVRHRFAYIEQSAEPRRRLAATLAQEKWQRIVCRFKHDDVKIQHKLPSFLPNYWNPIFVGRFIVEDEKHFLVGYFRAPWFIFLANFAAMLFTAYRLLSIVLMASMPGAQIAMGSNGEWRREVIFLGALVLLMIFGWLIGIPYARRIVAAIRESATSTAIPHLDDIATPASGRAQSAHTLQY